MFSTFKQKLLLGMYLFILLSIPVGTYLASQHTTTQSSATSGQKPPKSLTSVTPKPSTTSSAAKQLLSQPNLNPTPKPSDSPSSSEVATSFGPTLSFKVALEGRPKGSYASKLFVGITEGTLTTNPKFLLSFTVDVPASGDYSNLSLAGLEPGSSYTALIKGSAQIATSSAFTMSPSVTNLNNGEPINLISGDLNDDNIINNSDYSIMLKAFGATPTSANWNENADLNKDKVINAFDLAILTKNIGKLGASGSWTSPIPKVSTPSASLTTPSIGSPAGEGGYWLWLPK